jgi:shikimate dehydrogenase
VIRAAGVIGWPIGHSYSPAMQEAAFRALGLDWRYAPLPVRPERLAEAVRGADALGFVGLNVTVPHKEAVLALAEPDEEARAVGAANTLVFREGLLPRALNTDVHGFRMLLLEEDLVDRLAGRSVGVLGAGGAAKAVVRVLHDVGARVTVVSRSARRVSGGALPDCAHCEWTESSLATLLPSLALLVDATPRGLDPASTLALDALPSDAAVIDLVVRPSTPLVAAARRRGLRAATGTAMLVHQGARALEAWSGMPAPVEVMRSALSSALARVA